MNETELQRTIFSQDREFRYTLWRQWGRVVKTVAFIGLNPSTADEQVDDPTVRRCIRFAKDWGYDAMWMMNIFAFRATDPKVMLCRQSNASTSGIRAWGGRQVIGHEEEASGQDNSDRGDRIGERPAVP